MRKRAVLDAFLARIREDLDGLRQSQKVTQDGATHEESRSEHSKDTRSLETSYLARGLAERVVELERSLMAAGAMELKSFTAQTPISLSALVTLEDEETGELRRYFLTPVVGGVRLLLGDVEVVTLTLAAPLGRALLGQCVDDQVLLQTPKGLRHFCVSELC